MGEGLEIVQLGWIDGVFAYRICVTVVDVVVDVVVDTVATTDVDVIDAIGAIDGASLPGYKAEPGTVRIMSQRFGSLLKRVVRAFVKCDVQFFCFSISSFELNLRSGFSGFSGFSHLVRDVLWIFVGSRFVATPLPSGNLLRFGDGVRIASGLSPHRLSSRLPEFVIFKLSATGLGARFSTPNFSNKARALLKRVECDSERTTLAAAGPPFWLSLIGSASSSSAGRFWNKFAICETFGPALAFDDLSMSDPSFSLVNGFWKKWQKASRCNSISMGIKIYIFFLMACTCLQFQTKYIALDCYQIIREQCN